MLESENSSPSFVSIENCADSSRLESSERLPKTPQELIDFALNQSFLKGLNTGKPDDDKFPFATRKHELDDGTEIVARYGETTLGRDLTIYHGSEVLDISDKEGMEMVGYRNSDQALSPEQSSKIATGKIFEFESRTWEWGPVAMEPIAEYSLTS